MLAGLALNQYFNGALAKLSFEDACTHLRGFFEGPGSERKILGEWNAISLKTVMDENTDKSTSACLQLLIDKLSQLQHGLTPELRTVAFLTNKLVTSCQGIHACQFAVSDPPQELGPLINKLQSSITAYEKQNPEQVRAYYTDRRYHGKDNNDRYRGNQYRTRPRDQNRDRDRTRSRFTPRNKRCFVCDKEGCRSWNHTQEERNESKAKFKATNRDKFSRFDDHFDKRLNQYIAEYEDDDTDSDEELEEAFQTLTIDANTGPIDKNTQIHIDHFFTSFGQIEQQEATSMATNLANKAFSHSVMTTDITAPPYD